MKRCLILVFLLVLLPATTSGAGPAPFTPFTRSLVVPVAGFTCKRASSCDEAVREWCNGYARADGDGDGIPCENVCHSLSQVRQIRERIGC